MVRPAWLLLIPTIGKPPGAGRPLPVSPALPARLHVNSLK